MDPFGMIFGGLTLLALLALVDALDKWLKKRQGPELDAFELFHGQTSRNIALSVWAQSPRQLMAEAFKYAPVVRPRRERVQVAVPDIEPSPVFFKPGEPQWLAEYDAQPAIVTGLLDLLGAMVRDKREAIEPVLGEGPAGMGKTLLAKILTNEIRKRLGREVAFFEVFPADIPDVLKLDQVLRQVQRNPGCVLFIDEIHDLLGMHSRKLYLVLEEGRYKFENEPFPVVLPPFTMLAATTDWGLLHPALQRRWIRQQFLPQSRAQLEAIVLKRNQAFPCAPEAAALLVSRTYFSGAPWEALRLHQLALTHAKAAQRASVTVQDAQEIITRLELDDLGLGPRDRAVLKALFSQPKIKLVKNVPVVTHYAAAEEPLCVMAGLDKATYRSEVKPKLYTRKLLTVRGGQALTPYAETHYGYLKS